MIFGGDIPGFQSFCQGDDSGNKGIPFTSGTFFQNIFEPRTQGICGIPQVMKVMELGNSAEGFLQKGFPALETVFLNFVV